MSEDGDQGPATWHPLDDNGWAELRVNGKRITTLSSYPAAQEAAERINKALAADRIEELEKALSSIARNTCCDGCQEAARVARAALSPTPER